MTPGAVLWLEEALAEDPGAPCPPLAGRMRCDVCVVGGGLLGLWTALEIRERAPDASVVLLEAARCGFGASGRNGGWMTSWYDELDALAARFGLEHGAWLAARSSEAIDRTQAVCEQEDIACDLRRGGALWVASAAAQRGRLDAALAACHRAGAGAFVRRVDAAAVRRRTGSPVLLDGLELTDAATVHPGRLVRGLRRLALRRGVQCFEHSRVRRLVRRTPVAVHTAGGCVEAGAVVLAAGAWSARVRELRRAFVPVASHVVATAPIPEQLTALGWTGGELLGDTRRLVHYAQVTGSGRLVLGQGGGAIGPAGRVLARHAVDPEAIRRVKADLHRWFPTLADVPITHAWGGAVDHAPGHLPFVGAFGDDEQIHYGAGFSGNGVGPSALVGQILGRRALGICDELTSCGLVGGPPGYLPPEPLRTAGGHLVQAATRRAEAAEDDGRPADPAANALRRLVGYTVPRAFEPRLRGLPPSVRHDKERP
jgi:glycine/D-amino acid oxidase-like deaminating enzyme